MNSTWMRMNESSANEMTHLLMCHPTTWCPYKYYLRLSFHINMTHDTGVITQKLKGIHEQGFIPMFLLQNNIVLTTFLLYRAGMFHSSYGLSQKF